MKVFWLISACILIVGLSYAQSQEPPPTPSKTSQPPQDKTKSTQGGTERDQRDTEHSSSVIKVIPTPKTQEKATQEAKDREDKTSTDRWLMYFTGGLVAVGILQLFVFGLQARRLRQTVEATEKIGQAAIAAELPVVVAGNLTLHSIAEPVGSSDPIPYVGDIPPPFSKPEIVFYNYGRSNAIVTRSCLLPIIARELPESPVYDPIISYPEGGLPIQANRGSLVVDSKNPTIRIKDDQIAAIRAQDKFLWVYGFITYKDFLGNSHDCRFCYRWNVPARDAQPRGFVTESDTPAEYTRPT